MRVLLTTNPLFGHVNTLLPLALAARRAGHDVVVATGADMASHLEQWDLPLWPVGPRHQEAAALVEESWLKYFAATSAARAMELLRRAQSWEPDLVVNEETELAGPVIAQLCGARSVVHGLGLPPPDKLRPAIAESTRSIGRLCGAQELAADAHFAYLQVCPPSLTPPGARAWDRVMPIRHASGLAAGGKTAADLPALPHERTVHLTLGTVYTGNAALLRTTLEALSTLEVNVVATVGTRIDPRELGPQPEGVVIRSYIPHALILPVCDMVISHGGAGTMLGALAHGIPQLVCPQGADQFANGDALLASGAGLQLRQEQWSEAAVTAAAASLLGDSQHRAAARRIAGEIASMPDADQVLRSLVGA